MAVQFKVPASPKKNIFAIDSFLGVDLTNIGTSIDEVRSPNAENMVRWTPGKVRKRTGYKTKLQFIEGLPHDINRAKRSSDQWEEVVFRQSSNTYTFSIYEKDKPVKYIYFEIEYSGQYYVTAFGEDSTQQYTQNYNGTSTGVFNYFYTGWGAGEFKDFNKILVKRESSDDTDYFRVRNMRMCVDTEAETKNAWAALPWTVAPEEKGGMYVETGESPKPIYGCHIYKDGNELQNKVVNVNRALNTSSEWDTFNVTDTNQRECLAYEMADKFYHDNGDYFDGMEIFVEFDYMLTGNDVSMVLQTGLWDETILYVMQDTSGEVEHVKFNMDAYSYGYDPNVYLRVENDGDSAEVKIRQFSVVYAKDNDYVYTPAPEDEGNRLNLENIYDVGEKNYATISEYSYTRQTGHGSAELSATIGNSKITNRYVKVSFDLTAETDAPSEKIQQIYVRLTGNATWDRPIDIYTDNLVDKHFDVYTCAPVEDEYIRRIHVEFYIDYDEEDPEEYNCTIHASNIEIHVIEPKETYISSPFTYIFHHGNQMYVRRGKNTLPILAYTGANQHRSVSWQVNDMLMILDGEKLYKYTNDDGLKLASEDAYIPLITIGKSPSGGGQAYEPLNLIQPGFMEQFTVDSSSATERVFQLSFSGLDATEVQAWTLKSDGEWKRRTEGTSFTVNRRKGRVTFTFTPGETPITGEDNVRILAYKTITGYARRIQQCKFGILYGVGGACDRLFLSGNPEFQNWDFYSEQNNPTYFPDTNYSVIGSSKSAIKAYARVDNYLATFKDDYDNDQAAFIRYGDMVTNQYTNLSEPVFRIRNKLQGNGVITPYAVGYIKTEPLFLTKYGIYALTTADLTGKEYSQSRSFFLDGALKNESGLDDAIAVDYNDQYILALNNKFYILDGLQASRSQAEPYSTRQYAGFLCTNIPAFSMWEDEGELWIGTRDGKVCRFDTDINDASSYNDDGEPIYCCWETPDLDGHLFYKNKSFRYFAIRMMSALRTSVKMYSKKFGNWNFIKEDRSSGTYFDFEHIDFELFSFSTDRSEKVAHTKVRVKKVDKARFRVENDRKDEPFGLVDLALEYIESGNFKG